MRLARGKLYAGAFGEERNAVFPLPCLSAWEVVDGCAFKKLDIPSVGGPRVDSITSQLSQAPGTSCRAGLLLVPPVGTVSVSYAERGVLLVTQVIAVSVPEEPNQCAPFGQAVCGACETSK